MGSFLFFVRFSTKWTRTHIILIVIKSNVKFNDRDYFFSAANVQVIIMFTGKQNNIHITYAFIQFHILLKTIAVFI